MRTNLIKPKVEPKKTKKSTKTSDSALDMVIAFDTTGSMSSYLDAVRSHCKELVPKLLSNNPDMRIGIVAFGDYCDMKGPDKFGDAYQCLPLTKDENKLIKFITEAETTSGGDSDEFYELVIKKITEETDWREDAAKAVLLIADANPHKVGYSYGDIVKNSQIDWRKEAKKAADRGIKFDTLSIHGYSWYNELSKITGGVYAPFQSSSKTVHAVEASIYSKVSKTRGIFKEKLSCAEASGDRELTAMYAAYSKSLS